MSLFMAPVGQFATHWRQEEQKLAASSAGTMGLISVANPRW